MSMCAVDPAPAETRRTCGHIRRVLHKVASVPVVDVLPVSTSEFVSRLALRADSQRPVCEHFWLHGTPSSSVKRGGNAQPRGCTGSHRRLRRRQGCGPWSSSRPRRSMPTISSVASADGPVTLLVRVSVDPLPPQSGAHAVWSVRQSGQPYGSDSPRLEMLIDTGPLDRHFQTILLAGSALVVLRSPSRRLLASSTAPRSGADVGNRRSGWPWARPQPGARDMLCGVPATRASPFRPALASSVSSRADARLHPVPTRPYADLR